MKSNSNIYDIIIVGGGPAGLTSAIYSSRYKLNTILFTDSFGGEISTAHKICNYPGFKEIKGVDLANKIIDQAKELGTNIIFESVVNIKKLEDNTFVVESESQSLKTKKVILALGLKRRKLNIDREEELTGKGISYCATCDANFYKDKITAVIGGSDAAVTAALLLSDICKKTYLIYRKDKLRAVPSWVELVKKQPNVEILYNSEVKELIGEKKLEKIKLNTGKIIDLNCLFIEIGSSPNKRFIDKVGIETTQDGYIKVDKEQNTNIEGVYAAGDCTNKTDLKQVITSASQGAIAAYSVYKKIIEQK
jgi:thioredoxin reductase (NADPH)